MVDDYQITDAMMRVGGSFVSGLGLLFRRADAVNQAKLKAAFSDYFAEYAELVELGRKFVARDKGDRGS